MMTVRHAGPEARKRRPMRWRSRTAIGAVLAALLSTQAVGAAVAKGNEASCPSGLNWTYVSWPEWGLHMWQAGEYVVNSAQSEFLVAEQRTVNNSTDTAATATFTSSVSKTFTLTYSVGTSASLFNFLTASVNAGISTSTTTTTGVSASASVPPRDRVIGQYGVEAYRVNYTLNHYESLAGDPGENCTLTGSGQGTSLAPTVYSGWRVLPG